MVTNPDLGVLKNRHNYQPDVPKLMAAVTAGEHVLTVLLDLVAPFCSAPLAVQSSVPNAVAGDLREQARIIFGCDAH